MRRTGLHNENGRIKLVSVPCNLCDRYGGELIHREGQYKMLRCPCCDFIYLNPRPDPTSLRSAYQSYLPDDELGIERWRAMIMPVFPWAADFIDEARPKGRILDVGTGYGHFLVEMERRGWEALGLEISGTGVEFARDRLGVNILAKTLEESRLPVRRTLSLERFLPENHGKVPGQSGVYRLSIPHRGIYPSCPFALTGGHPFIWHYFPGALFAVGQSISVSRGQQDGYGKEARSGLRAFDGEGGMKGWLGSLMIFSMSVALSIQAAAQAELDKDFVLRQLARVQREVVDFTADLTQEKRISLLREKVISHGVIEFKRPNKVLIELFDPDPSLMVVDGNTLWLYFKRERVAQRYQVGDNPMLKRYLMILENPFKDEWGKLASIRKEGDLAVLEIIPGEVETIYSKVTLWVSTQSWLIRKLALYEKSGDFTILSYENIRVNTGIPDSHFTLDLPADVQILQPAQ